MTQKELQALYKSRKKAAIEAGITDKLLLTRVASGKILLEDALKQAGVVKIENGLAGEEPKTIAGEHNKEAIGGTQQPTENQSEYTKENASTTEHEKEKEVKKAEKKFILTHNVYCNGQEYRKGEEVNNADKNFKDLEKFLE